MQVLPRMMKLWSMARNIARSTSITSFTLSQPTNLEKLASLVDRGANGGIAGDDVHIIEKSDQTVDVRGIDNHQITNIPIVTAMEISRPSMDLPLPFCTRMHTLDKARPSILQVNLSGIKMMSMTSPSRLQEVCSAF